MKIAQINLTLLLFALTTLSLSAQKKGRSFERIKAHKMTFIVENSNLNAAEESIFWEIFGPTEDTLYKDLFRRKREIIKELKENSASLAAAEIKAKIELLDQLESEKVKVIKNRNQALMKQLSPHKALEIINASEEFSREMFRRGQGNTKKQEEKTSPQ
ncbi:MAG: hypothetical protein ACO3SY_07570 [Flavobacteriaceae bacterium]